MIGWKNETYHSRVRVQVAIGRRITNPGPDFTFDPVEFTLQNGRTRRENFRRRRHYRQPFVPHVRNDSIVRMHDMYLKFIFLVKIKTKVIKIYQNVLEIALIIN